MQAFTTAPRSHNECLATPYVLLHRRDYGFTVPGNPNDRIVLPAAEALSELNAESLLQALGLEGKGAACWHSSTPSSPPDPFIALPPGDWQQQGDLTPIIAVQGKAGKDGQQQAAAAEQLALLLSGLSALAGEVDSGSGAGSSGPAGTATMRRLRCALLSLKLNDGYTQQQQSKGGSSDGGLFAGLFPQAWSKSGN